MSVTTALIKNLFSGGLGKFSTVIIRLIQVPILISALGVKDYGVWLVLSSLPAWLTMANLGFGSVAANEITMLVAADNNKKANEIYSTTLMLVAIIACIGIIIVSLIVPFINWKSFFSDSSQSNTEFVSTILLLSLSVFISFSSEVFNSRFRAAQKVYQSMLLSSARPWIDLLGIVIVVSLNVKFHYLALASLVSTVLFLVITIFLSRSVYSSMRFKFTNTRKEYLKFLFSKGFAFQAFPLGNAVLYQGSLIVIQTIIGSSAVALFGTARTLVRSVNQMMELINQAIWPELSYILGVKDFEKARKLHRFGVSASFFLAISGTIFLVLFGQTLYSKWTGNALKLDTVLLILFLIPIPFNALWNTSGVVHVACNQHEKLATFYLIANLLSIIGCIGLSYFWGIKGAALSTLIADVVLIPFVFAKSLMLTNDNWIDFRNGVFSLKNSSYNIKKFYSRTFNK